MVHLCIAGGGAAIGLGRRALVELTSISSRQAEPKSINSF